MGGLNDKQFEVDEWISQYKIGYWKPLSILARVTEEVGELATELNDRYGGRVKKPTDDTKDIGDEIADVMFALICLANSQNIDLDKHFDRIMDKCYGRDKDRFEKK
ncbi:nucleotide pyrophosphohydrolase [Candidatus Pacearchaeota archaeon]|nr:nucleotide pyrophosphohydrolase [Candidatus Pacearchaeota archaeon]